MPVSRRELVTSAIAGAVVLVAGCTTGDSNMGHKDGDYSDRSVRDAESLHDVATKADVGMSESGEFDMTQFLLIKAGLDNVADALDNIADAIREHE